MEMLQILSHAPKYLVIKENLKGRLGRNVLRTGDKIRPLALAREFGASMITVERALRELSEEGYVKRGKGNGTIVVSSTGCVKEKTACMVMSPSGHMWEKIYGPLVKGLADRDYRIVNFPEDSSLLLGKWRSLVSSGPDIMIIAANNEFPYQVLEQSTLPFLIFAPYFEGPRRHPGAYIIPGWHELGFLSAAHLLEKGYERIVFYAPAPDDCVNPTHLQQKLAGVKEALAGFRGKRRGRPGLIACRSGSDSIERLVEEIPKWGRNAGVICFYDFLALDIYKACQRLGMWIPKDLGVVGAFNTPWSECLTPPLTSVSIQENLIVEEVLRQADSQRGGTFVVPPVLVERESTRKIN